jgi:hypothetical protein
VRERERERKRNGVKLFIKSPSETRVNNAAMKTWVIFIAAAIRRPSQRLEMAKERQRKIRGKQKTQTRVRESIGATRAQV